MSGKDAPALAAPFLRNGAERVTIRCLKMRADTVPTDDEKAKQVCERLSKESKSTVEHKWNIDEGYFRFYFKDGDQDWRYILDVYQGDMNELGVDELMVHLETHKWKQMVQTHSGTLVPFLKDRKFTAPSDFRTWPSKVGKR